MTIVDGRDGYSTHLEALAYAMGRSRGPVVELGAGWYSTPMLHGLCEAQDRVLWTIEQDPQWAERFRSRWACPWHRVDVAAPFIPFRGCGLVFVDNDPAPPTRAEMAAEALESDAGIVVVHDVNLQPDNDGLDAVLGTASYRRDWTEAPQHTAAVSNRVRL